MPDEVFWAHMFFNRWLLAQRKARSYQFPANLWLLVNHKELFRQKMASKSMTTTTSKVVFRIRGTDSRISSPTFETLTFRRSVVVNFSSNDLKKMNRNNLMVQYSGICTATVKRNPKRLKYFVPRFTHNKDDGFVYVKIDPSGSDTWKLEPVVNLLREGAVGVIPTDTVYAIVCDVRSHSAIERLRRIKDIGPSKPLSIICRSFRDIDTYTLGFPRGTGQGQTNIFRVVKHCLPGPYTFILPASKELPKQCSRYGTTTARYASRKSVGVRIPNDAICHAILEKLDAPLISTSVKWPKADEWMIDPVLIADIYEPEGLDFVVDGGVRVANPSTVVDTTRDPLTIIRLGKGPKQDWMILQDDKDSSAMLTTNVA